MRSPKERLFQEAESYYNCYMEKKITNSGRSFCQRLFLFICLLFGIHAYAANDNFFTLPPDTLPIQVGVGIYVDNINSINEGTNVIDTVITELDTWQDSRLKFKANGSNEKIYRGPAADEKITEIWRPYLRLFPTTESPEQQSTILIINSEGVVKHIKTMKVSIDANINARRFPFDTQTFLLGVKSQAYNNQQIKLVKLPNYEGMDSHISTPNWKISHFFNTQISEHYASYLRSPVSTYYFSFSYTRQSTSYVLDIFVPLMALVALAYLFLFVKLKLGDLLQVMITLVLTMIAFQWLLFNIIPDVSYTNFLDIIILLSFLFNCFAIVGVCCIHLAGEKFGLSGASLTKKITWIGLPLFYILGIILAIIWFYYLR